MSQRLVGYGVSQVPTNGMLGGMAYQDPINVSVGNISASSYDNGLWTSEKTFNVQFPSGTSNQKVQIYWPTGSRLQGGYEVTIATGYEYASASGMLRKTFGIHAAENGGLYVQRTTVPFALGYIASWFTISDIQWDSTNSRWYVIIANLAGTTSGSSANSGNTVTITVKSHLVAYNNSVWLNARASAASISSIYSTDTTVYPILSAPITDNNGNFIIGAATSTGTASQPLQVTGGAYVSGSFGIGTTNPTQKLQVYDGSINVYKPTGEVNIQVESSDTSVVAFRAISPYRNWRFGIQGGTNADFVIRDATSSANRLGITSAGEVIIGSNTTPLVPTGTASQPLQVTGGAYVSGSVGIGTVNPPAKLSVDGAVIFGNTTSSGSGGTLRVVESGNSVYIQPGSNTSNDSSCDLIISSINGVIEKLRITSGGNVQIANGNLVIGTSGKGIDFSAAGNAAGMNSELLDDYEEGTWTPSVGGTATYNTQTSGTYTKIGNLVYCSCRITINVLGTGSATAFGGLPFTPSQTGSINAGGGVSYYNSSATSVAFIGIQISTVSNNVLIVGTSGAQANITNGVTFFQNGTDFIVSFFYKA